MRASASPSWRKILLGATLTILAVAAFLPLVEGTPALAATQPPTGIILPLFSRPGSIWLSLIQAKLDHPSVPIVAIVNPSSGPGSFRSSSFASGIQDLQSAGIVVLGYVYTGYGSRNASQVEADVGSYISWYGVDGILFDEMSTSPSLLPYYSELNAYAKSNGLNMTVGNPGRDVPSSFVGVFDTIVVYENVGLPSLGFLSGWHSSYAKTYFAAVAIGVPSLDTSFVQAASNYVGYVYVTDDSLPNPYDSLPSYFSSLVASLDPGTQSTTGSTTTITTEVPPVTQVPPTTAVPPPTPVPTQPDNSTVAAANDTSTSAEPSNATAPPVDAQVTPDNSTAVVPTIMGNVTTTLEGSPGVGNGQVALPSAPVPSPWPLLSGAFVAAFAFVLLFYCQQNGYLKKWTVTLRAASLRSAKKLAGLGRSRQA